MIRITQIILEEDMTKPTQTKFGISFKGKPDYTYSEVRNFAEIVESGKPFDESLNTRYIDFCYALASGRVKSSTLVDEDVLQVFFNDLGNRVNIDLTWKFEDDDLYKGALYFLGRFRALYKAHPNLGVASYNAEYV